MKYQAGFERSIKIEITAEVGNWHKAYVKVGSLPLGDKEYSWESWDGVVDIGVNDKGYVREGTYYVKVIATTDRWG